MKIGIVLILVSVSISFMATDLLAQQDINAKLDGLELRISQLESDIRTVKSSLETVGEAGMVAFLFGAFCALWAQNTGRNAWRWFFLGLFFHVITVCVLLYKHSNRQKRDAYERRREKRFERLLAEYQQALTKIEDKEGSA